MKKFFWLTAIFIPLFFNKATSQCPTVVTGSNYTICSGQSTKIGYTSQNQITYSWSPTIGLSNSSISNPIASPNSTTTYTLSASSLNLIQNGNFEQGNFGFGTDYRFIPNTPIVTSDEGQYHICANAQTFNGNWCNNGNHTPLGNNMMVIDGMKTNNPSQPNNVFWRQNVTVLPSKDYLFSVWFQSLYSGNIGTLIPQIQISFNGVVVNTFALPWNHCPWTNLQFIVNSGNTTSAFIQMRDITTYGDLTANDFSVDDISLTCRSISSFNVNVNNTPQITPVGPIDIYYVYDGIYSFSLKSNTTNNNQWYKNGVLIRGATSQIYIINFTGHQTINDVYTVITSGCISNSVIIKTIGCLFDSEYPVPIPHSVSPPSLTTTSQQLDLGRGSIYSWIQNSSPGSCGLITNVDPAINTCTFDMSNCTINNTGFSYSTKAANGNKQVLMYPPSMYYNFQGRPALSTNKVISRLYPNPATSQIIVSANESNILSVDITNMFGKVLRRINVNSVKDIKVNIFDLPNGYYNCRVLTNKGIENQKLIISR